MISLELSIEARREQTFVAMLSIFRVGPRLLPRQQLLSCAADYSTKPEQPAEGGKKSSQSFRVLNLGKIAINREKRFRRPQKPIRHRYQTMKPTQDWGNVWPAPRSFHPSVVPLPIRQGYLEKNDRPAPDKFANAELMKIPNFLHLTPPVIKRQCEAIKKFCTRWPKGLETDEKCEKHFPVEYISTDYVQALPTIRNRLSRIVSIRFKLSALPLDAHARDKFLRLIEDRYNIETDIVTLTADRCPLRVQNYEYLQYLMTALFHESFIAEPWESLKSEADMEYYDWSKNRSKQIVDEILSYKNSDDKNQISTIAFAEAVERLFNEGENEQALLKYKEESLKLLGLAQ